MLPGLEGENIARLEEEVAEGGERGDLGRKPALTQSYKEYSHTSQSYKCTKSNLTQSYKYTRSALTQSYIC